MWQEMGEYEYEYVDGDYTGWYRCIDGRLASGLWPQWNANTGEMRYG